jgi:hypothetical protein
MVYNTHHYWGFLLLLSSGILENRKYDIFETKSVTYLLTHGAEPF